MLRRDFISKIIEQMLNAIARLVKVDYEKETEKFLVDFQVLLKTYFKIEDKDLDILLEPNEERDEFLLSEKMKNSQLAMFVQAGLAYILKDEPQKAKHCLAVIERVQHQHSTIFEFPTPETHSLNDKIEELRKRLALKQ